jgi:hypothetical protein
MKMRWFAVYSAAMAARCIHVASAQAQPVPQAPAGNAVPVTADNFNRAEIDMYFGTIVKDRGGNALLNALGRPHAPSLIGHRVCSFYWFRGSQSSS